MCLHFWIRSYSVESAWIFQVENFISGFPDIDTFLTHRPFTVAFPEV